MSARLSIHYGWITVGLLLFMMTVSHGITTTGISVFDERIINELGISRGTLKFRDFVQIIAAGLSGLTIGYVVTRIPAERICQLGLLLLGCTLFTYSMVTNVWAIYALHFVLGFCYASAHVVIVILFVSEWFSTKRAIAISIALSGTSIGSAIFPQIAVAIMEDFGWRGALRVLALFPLIVLPLMVLFLRRSPESLGKTSYGTEKLGTEITSTSKSAIPFDFSDPSTRRDLALLIVATIGVFYAASAFIFHTYLHLRDQGFGEGFASNGLTIIFLTGLFGKVLSGIAADKLGTRKIWLGCQLMLLTAGLIVTFYSTSWIWLGLMALGLGWAGCYTLTQVMISERFAGPMLSKLVGWFIVFEAIGSGSGSWLTGVMYDTSGSYTLPFTINCSLIAIACCATYMLGRNEKAATEPR